MNIAPTSAHPSREQNRTGWLLVAILACLLGGLAVALLYQVGVFEGSSTSATVGSGVPATQTRDVAAFNSLELAGSNNVAIHVGETQSVVVRADDNLLDTITTEVKSGNLIIGNTQGSVRTKSPMSVEVNVPTLEAVTLSGSGNTVVDGVGADSFQVTLLGSGTITGSGAAARLDIRVSGSGTVRLTGLVARDVRAVLSGSGSVLVTATESLDASVSGSGAILYGGNPHDVAKSVTGTGTISGGP